VALKETPTVALSGSTVPVAGQVYLVNGIPTICPSTGAGTISTWTSTIGGSPTIAACDAISRTHGAFLPSTSPLNMNLQGQKGCDIFEF
jgi:hypothetical protein